MSAEIRSQKVARWLAMASALCAIIAVGLRVPGLVAIFGLAFAVAAAAIEIRGARRGFVMILVVVGSVICAPIAWKSMRNSRYYEENPDVESFGNLPDLLELCASAQRVEVFEGLPHQTWERELLDVEKQRPDVFSSHEFSFYSPALNLPVSDRDRLLSKVKSSATFKGWFGEKMCGGFHPDLLFRFHHSSGIVDLHLCIGCHEAHFYGPSLYARVDLESSEVKELEEIQRRHRTKRPQKDRQSVF